jgi:hypothetical protein
MKSIALSLFIFLSASGIAQDVNIYSKWTAFPDEKTQIIIDLSDVSRLYVKKIQLIERDRYRIDSFGYKRACSMMVRDLDSSAVFWVAALEPLHPSIPENQYVGEFYVTERNWNGTPVRMKMSDEIPDLTIYFSEGDSLEFIRMVTKDPDELSKHYPTFYGGRIEETIYYGEHGGSSGGISGVGMRYSQINLSKSFKNYMTQIMMSTVNSQRAHYGRDAVDHDNNLDGESQSGIFSWIREMKEFHQIDKFSYPYMKDEEISDSVSKNDQLFAFFHYPFQCGKNIVLLASTSNFTSSRKKCIRYLKEHKEALVDHAISSMMNKKGARQNMLNQGYATVGFDVQLIKGNFDDFYFDENGHRVQIKRRKNPYYFFMLSQTFSVNESQ